MKKLIIEGGASKKIIHVFELETNDLEINLLEFLADHHIPVASSCGGDGICQKCYVQNRGQKLLSCQFAVGDLFVNSLQETLTFSYL